MRLVEPRGNRIGNIADICADARLWPCPKWVNRVILTAGRSLPVFPDKQTFSVSVGMSQTGQKATEELSFTLFDQLVRYREQGVRHRHSERARGL
jgi:hypothetical protein